MCRSNGPRQLLAHDHFSTRIHSNEVKATLAEIHSDCSDRSLCVTMSLMARSFRESAAPFTRLGARPVHTIIWVDGSVFRWTEQGHAGGGLTPGSNCHAINKETYSNLSSAPRQKDVLRGTMDEVSSLWLLLSIATRSDQNCVRLGHLILLIPCWKSQRADPEEKLGPARDIKRRAAERPEGA